MFKKVTATLTILISFLLLSTSSAGAAVSINQSWASDFYGPNWGSLYESSCPAGSVISGVAGADAEGWISAGLKFNCVALESTNTIGTSTPYALNVFTSTYWNWATLSPDLNCSSGKVGTGMEIQQDAGNLYILNFGLNCSKYNNQSDKEFTGYYGAFFGNTISINCPTGYWLTGVNYKSGWGLDGLGIKCSTFLEISSPSTFKITATTNEGGSITPEGDTFVEMNATQVYRISPASGYQITNVLVDGLSKGVISTYSFVNVTSTHNITVIFNQIQGNRQATLGSCASRNTQANKSSGNGLTNNASSFCTSTAGPTKITK
jgi:hypothetical protein